MDIQRKSHKVLVTGGAGFIGSHLCDRLIAEGYLVHCVDNLGSGQFENIKHLLEHEHFTFSELDITQQNDVEQLEHDYTLIFHLASPASPQFYMTRRYETMLANTLGTHWLISLAERCRARFVFTSTSEMYGDPLEHPQPETYRGNVNPVGKKAHYKEAKRFGETVVITHVRETNVDGRIVRIFNTYGPRNRPNDGRVIPNFINQALRGESLTVYGEGAQTRSFCYVSDLVEGLMKVMFTEDLQGEVFNLGNPDEYTILETASTVNQLVGNDSDITYEPLPAEDPHRRKPDITKAQEMLDWHPVVTFEEGLMKTIDYYRTLLP